MLINLRFELRIQFILRKNMQSNILKKTKLNAGEKVWVRPNSHIWSGAEQFFKAAEVLMDDTTVGMPNMVYPVITNYALCVELALKAAVGRVVISPPTKDGLISAASIGSEAWGHDLEAVFNSLPEEIQVAIASDFHIWTGENIHSLLKNCAHYFVHARYAHEKKAMHYDLSGIRTLAYGVLAAVHNYGLVQEGRPPLSPPAGA
ncbi:MAG: hypothetical protein ACK59X_25385 [Acidovorax sp.]